MDKTGTIVIIGTKPGQGFSRFLVSMGNKSTAYLSSVGTEFLATDAGISTVISLSLTENISEEIDRCIDIINGMKDVNTIIIDRLPLLTDCAHLMIPVLKRMKESGKTWVLGYQIPAANELNNSWILKSLADVKLIYENGNVIDKKN